MTAAEDESEKKEKKESFWKSWTHRKPKQKKEEETPQEEPEATAAEDESDKKEKKESFWKSWTHRKPKQKTEAVSQKAAAHKEHKSTCRIPDLKEKSCCRKDYGKQSGSGQMGGADKQGIE